ncbi:hypothetical protein [Nitratireductor sp. GCM10026969]|uniref:hypothetical protein n=1 Tax=Nitratireductor sp. GCM10026969 TaxID=3252645 RepID=UPI0036077F88
MGEQPEIGREGLDGGAHAPQFLVAVAQITWQDRAFLRRDGGAKRPGFRAAV